MMRSTSSPRSASSRTAAARWQTISLSVLLPVGLLFAFVLLLNSQPAFALGGTAEVAVEPQAVIAQTGAIYYVTTTGTGTACTIATPCTLATALNQAQNGAEVRIAAGTYTAGASTEVLFLQRNVTWRGGFTPANWDVPDPVANPTILDGENNKRVIWVFSGNPVIEGLVIRNGNATTIGGAGVYVSGGSVTLRYNRIHNNTAAVNENGAGIYISPGLNATIEFNHLHNNSGSGTGSLGGAIYMAGNGVIEGNIIHNNTAAFGGGIFGTTAGSTTLLNNVIYQNTATTIFGSGGIGFEGTGTLNIWHNTIANNSAPNAANGGGGIAMFMGNISIRNNIVANNTAAGGSTGIRNAGATLTGAYNNLFNNTSNDGGTLTDPIVGDPLFVNVGAGDYRLQAASPNINAADPASPATRDFEQQPRPFNGGFDVGADEYYPAGATCFARLNSGGVDGPVFGTIQTVVNLASAGDTVKVAGYCTAATDPIVTLADDITLQGGYSLTDWTEANRGQAGPTILDGEGARRLIHITAGNPTVDSLSLTGGNAVNGPAIYVEAGNPTLQNNLIYDNTATDGGAIGTAIGTTPLIHFNTIANNSGDGIRFGLSGAIHNSILYNNSGSQINGGTGHTYNLVGIDPLFVDQGNDDYRLTAASPALDIGDPTATLTYDFEGDPRPRGQRPDAGADEANDYPSARFIPATVTAEIERGTTETYNLVFNSNGTLDDTWNLTSSQVQGWDISHPTLGNVNAGQILPFGVVVTAPLSATPATPETIIFTATSTINPNAQATAVLNLAIRPIRQILFTPSYSQTLFPGEVITLTHTVTNNGEFTDTVRVRIVSDPSQWGQLLDAAQQPAPGNSFTVTLAAGQSSLVYIRVTVGESAPAGFFNDIVVRAESVADTAIFAQVVDRITARPTVGTRYVATTGNDTNNNCRVVTQPCATVARGVGQAAVGDEIRIGAGNYVVTEIPINATISLRGGWNGTFTQQLAAETIISASGNDRLFNISGGTTTARLERLTLRDGNRTTGGAILVRNGAQPTLTQLKFISNQAQRGGALYVSGGTTVFLEKSIFRTNTASVDGGAIFVEGLLTSHNNLLEDNQATGNGGGYYIRGAGSAFIWHNTLDGNSATSRGGAIYLESGSLTARNNSITNNQAGLGSGAIHRAAGTLTVDYNNIWNNSAPASNQPNGNNSVSVDPLYIDTEFRLSAVSPILDMGDPASPLEEDFEGNARPSDQGFDIGWYELAGCLARRDGIIYLGIQEAIAAGGAPLIQVSGVCRGVNTLDIGGGQMVSQTVRIQENIHLQGGWNASFNNNVATNPQPTFIDPQGLGRGMYIFGGASPIIESIAIRNGTAVGLGGGPNDEDAGGGIYIESGSPLFSQIGVYSNTAELGGGIYNHTGSPTFGITGTHGTVLDDTADTRVSDIAYNTAALGGGFYNHTGAINLGNAFVRWNEAQDGAGIYLATGTTGTVANSVIYQNEALGNGGGLYNQSNASLLHLTFYANHAAGNGGALHTQGNPVVRSNIFQANTAASGPAIFHTTGTPNVGYNYYHSHLPPAVVGTGQGTGSINSATPPGLIAPALGNFRLSGTAAAIDKADPNSPLTTDMENDLRPSNLGFDIGADELAGCYARVNGTIYGSPQVALANASAGDQIDVAGICIGVQAFDTGGAMGIISQTLRIDKDVIFLGGWRTDFSQRDDVTVLDALGLGRVIYVANGISATVRSFDIRGGNGTVAGGINGHGGGIYVDNAQPTFEQNNIFENTAANGGGIYLQNSTATIAGGNHIYHNTAANGAGIAVNNPSGQAQVYNNFIYENTATNQGGGLLNQAGSSRLVHNTVVENSAAVAGGGIHVAAGSPTVRSNIFAENIAPTGSGGNGAVGSNPSLGYNTFYLNDTAGTMVGGTGNVTANPGLNPDYTINPTSPALNAGDPNSPILVDYEGDRRPSNQYPDMGADEIAGCYARIVGDGEIYYSIQAAINAAPSGATVETDGRCLGVNTQTVSSQAVRQGLFINKNLVIDGSWNSGLSDISPETIVDAQGNGRGLFVTDGVSVTVRHVTIINGNAAQGGLNALLGGGVYNHNGQLTLSHMRLYDNAATDGAGVFQPNTGSLRLEQSTLLANIASARGGALFVNGGTTTIQNNFIYDNESATGGGGIFHAAGTSQIWHNTLVGNTSDNNLGAGLFLQGGTPVVGNNIVDNHTGSGIHATPAGLNIRYNNVVNNSGGNYTGNAADVIGGISVAPLYVNPALPDYHLQENSRGVDEGDPASPVTNDVDGQGRPVNGGFDMGADEVGSCLIRVMSGNPELIRDFGVVQDAIDYAEANNLTELRVARGECSGVREKNGTFQVGYITQDLNFIGSLARPNFTPTDDYGYDAVFAPSTRFNALDDGRVIYIAADANPTFVGIAFVGGNAAGSQGGAIYNLGGTVLIDQTAICQSIAQDGGGVYNGPNSDLTIQGTGARMGTCTLHNVIEAADGTVLSRGYISFARLEATQHGGAAYNNGRLYLSGNFVASNTAVQHGAGVYNNGDFAAQNVIFRFNAAEGNGAAIYNGPSANNVMLVNNVFFQNTAVGNGGGIYHSNSVSLDLYHNTFNGNQASEGGAIYNANPSMVLNSNILYANVATTGSYGGIWSATADDSTFTYNNFFANAPNDSNVGVGSDAVLANPNLYSQYRLPPTSPALDAADPVLWTTDSRFERDIRLLLRPDGGPANAAGVVTPYRSDIGVYELEKIFMCDILPPFEERTIQAGDTTTYTVRLLNLGGEGLWGPTGIRDRIGIELNDSSLGWATLVGGPSQEFELNWLAFVDLELVVTAPPTAVTSNVETSLVRCESLSNPLANMQATFVTRIAATPGVIVIPDHDLIIAEPGQVITYAHTVQNIGNNDDTFELIASPGPNYVNALLVNLDGTPLADPVVALSAGQAISTWLRVTVLNDAPVGGLATPGVIARSTADPTINGAAVNPIQIDFTTGHRYVGQGDTSDEHNNCTVLSNPCATVQHAVNQASPGDSVFVSVGVYTDYHTRTVGMDVVTQTLFINKPITITGGYNSADEYTTYQPLTNTVVLNGSFQHRVIYVDDAAGTVTLRGFIVADGYDALQGAGLFNEGADLHLNGLLVLENAAKFGAGIYHQAGLLEMQSSIVARNRSLHDDNGDGAGLYIETGTAVLENNTIADNQANYSDSLLAVPPTPGNAYGGGFYQADGELILLNNILASNAGVNNGGEATSAFYVDLANTTIITHGYNLYFQNASNVPLQATDLTADPLFVDIFYHLSDFSPAVDVATLSTTLSLDGYDIDGEVRLMGLGLDIGADELLQVPDFTFLPPLQTALIDSGEVYTYEFTITNVGDLTDSYTITRSSQTSGGAGWDYALPITTVLDLVVGDAITIPLVITGGSPGYVDTTELTAVSTLDPTLTRVVTAVTTIRQEAGVLITPNRAGSAAPGQTVVYTHTLTNSGNGPDSFTLAVASQLPAGWVVTVNPLTTASLLPNDSVPVTVTVTVPNNGVAGVVHTAVIQAASDYDPDVTGQVTDTTTILPIYGLQLTPEAATYNSLEGTTVVYTHTLTNLGNLTDTVTIAATTQSGPSWTVTPLNTPVLVSPFGSAVISVSLAIPAGTTGQTHVMGVTATSGVSVTVQATAVNTTTATDIPVVDMTIVPNNTGEGLPGQSVVYTHTLTNLGNATDTFEMFTNDHQPTWLSQVVPSPVTLAAGQSRVLTVTVFIPPSALPGQGNITTVSARSTLDPDVFATATDTTTVSEPAANGVLIAPDNSLATLAGETVYYYHTVTNTGTVADTYNLTAVSSEGWDVTVAPTSLSLAAGASQQIEVQVVVPLAALPGTVDTTTVTATSTGDGTVADSAVNTTTITNTISALLSLVPNQVGTGAPNGTAVYQHTLTNLGNASDTITLQTSDTQGLWSSLVVPTQVTLGPGQQAAVQVTVSIPAGAAEGEQNTTTIRAQSGLEAAVSATAINTTTVVIPEPVAIYLPVIMRQEAVTPPPPTPTPTPTETPTATPTIDPGHVPTCIVPSYGSVAGVDLVVESIQAFPSNPTVGQAVTIRVTIRNQGSQSVAVGNNFYLDAYFNRVPAPAMPGDVAWGAQGAHLTANTSRVYEASYVFNAPGTYWMYAQVDTDNTVAEVNEGNNLLGGCEALNHSISVTGTALREAETPTPVPPAGTPRVTPTPEAFPTPSPTMTPEATATITAEPTVEPTATAEAEQPTVTATPTLTPQPPKEEGIELPAPPEE